MQQKNINQGDGKQNVFTADTINIQYGAEDKRLIALDNLYGYVQDVVQEELEQSIHQLTVKELRKSEKVSLPHQVDSPWGMILALPNQAVEDISPEERILDVFMRSRIRKRLWLLGQTGSGKTTTMLELATGLLQRYKEDHRAPIPIPINLASWKPHPANFFDWLVQEISDVYPMGETVLEKRQCTANLLREHKLIPLLDGMDAITPGRQIDCAIAIHEWINGNIHTQPVGVLICCQKKVYEKVNTYLDINAKLEIQPLTNSQIEAYLEKYELEINWQHFQKEHPDIRDLISRPLFLSIFVFVSFVNDSKLDNFQQQDIHTDPVSQLFNQYWIAAMKRKLTKKSELRREIKSKAYGKKDLPDDKQLKRALRFVAHNLKVNSRTDFMIERLDAKQLSKKQQNAFRKVFRIVISIIFALFPFLGLSWTIVAMLFNDVPKITIALIAVAVAMLMYGYLGFCVAPACLKLDTPPIEKIKFDFLSFMMESQKYCKHFFVGLLFCVVGLPLLLQSFPVGIMLALLIVPLVWIAKSLTRSSIVKVENPEEPNQGMKKTGINLIRLLALIAPLVLLQAILAPYFFSAIMTTEEINFYTAISSILIILLVLIFGGGLALLKHFSLRITLAMNNLAPLYRYDRLLDYAVERRILQRVGGRYRFIHRLLQDHFAAKDFD